MTRRLADIDHLCRRRRVRVRTVARAYDRWVAKQYLRLRRLP